MLEWAKILIPTIGAIIVFVTWRGGKAIDLVSEFYKHHGEAIAEIYGLLGVVGGGIASAQFVEGIIDSTIKVHNINPIFRESFVLQIKTNRNTLDDYDKSLKQRLYKLNILRDQMTRQQWSLLKLKTWAPLSLRVAGNCIGDVISIYTMTMQDKPQIQEVSDRLLYKAVFRADYFNSAPISDSPAPNKSPSD